MSFDDAAAPVKVVLFSCLYPNSVLPRAGVFVETRLRELMRTGRVQAKVVAPVRWSPTQNPKYGVYAQMAAAPRRENLHGVDVLHPRFLLIPKMGMSVSPFLLALGALPAFRQLQAEGFDFEVIDAHYYFPDGVAAALLAKWLNRPFTVTARGSDINLIGNFRWSRWLMKRCAHHAQASIGVSSALVRKMKDLGFDERRLLTMRNGVDLELFQPPVCREEVRRNLSLEGHPLILTVGNLHEHKGQYLVIKAMPEIVKVHPGARLVVLGDGPDEKQLKKLVDDLNILPQVLFVPAMPQSELCQWYGAADVLVLASAREGWPNVLLETMATGTPVVATDVGGVREIVAEACAGEVIPERHETAISKGVVEVLARQINRADVRKYAEKFSWERTSLDQAELFEKIAGRSNTHLQRLGGQVPVSVGDAP